MGCISSKLGNMYDCKIALSILEAPTLRLCDMPTTEPVVVSAAVLADVLPRSPRNYLLSLKTKLFF